MLRLRISGTIPPLSLHKFMAYTGTTLFLALLQIFFSLININRITLQKTTETHAGLHGCIQNWNVSVNVSQSPQYQTLWKPIQWYGIPACEHTDWCSKGTRCTFATSSCEHTNCESEPKWHFSLSVFSVPPNKNQDIGNLCHQTIMLALTSANSQLCRWNSRESCSPTATRNLSLVMAGVGMSNSMGLSDLASSLQTYILEYNRSSNRIYINLYQPHITLLQVLGHSLYAQLLYFFTTNTISCNLWCHHQMPQDSSIWNPVLPEEQTFTIQLTMFLNISKLAEHISGMQNTQTSADAGD